MSMGTIKSLQRKRIKEGGQIGNGVLKGGKKINRNCQLQQVWIWPEQVEDLIRPLIEGRSLNICAGLSSLGDVKVDIEPRNENVQLGDMNNLDFKDNEFDTVISDPPWKIGFFNRMKPFFEAVRVCKVGGRIIYNCTWKPVNKCVELEKVYLRTDNNWCNFSAIWIFRKIKDISSLKKSH
jgi:ubiquinone/menaquinone biosynthesis C-methylase UbiE